MAAPGDLLVVNDSRVIPARLRGTRAGGGGRGAARSFASSTTTRAAGRRSSGPPDASRPAITIEVASGDRVVMGERRDDGTRAVIFDRDPLAVMASAGEMPLPPYIRGRSVAAGALPDRLRALARLGRGTDRRPPFHAGAAVVACRRGHRPRQR